MGNLSRNAETLVDLSSVLKGVGMTGFFGSFSIYSRNPKLKKLANLKDFFINSRQSLPGPIWFSKYRDLGENLDFAHF